jgi:C-terminal processing protease CtpA/Prc
MKANKPIVASRSGRNYMFVAVLAFMAATLSPQTLHAQTLDRIQRERALIMLNVVKDDLKSNYYDPNFRGMNLETRFKAAEEKIKQASSLGQTFGIIAQTLLDLNDSHAFFIPPQRPERVEYGWNMQMIGDKCYVVAVKPGSDAELKGLKPGDQIHTVENFKPSRGDIWKMNYYYRALSPRPGLRVIAQSPGGEPRQLDLAAKVVKGALVVDVLRDLSDLLRQSENEDRLDRHRFYDIGSVVIWKMPNFSFEPNQANSIMSDRVNGHAALVLDLRGNQGGYVKTLEQLTGNFFDHDLKIADRKGRKEMKPQFAKTRGGTIFKGKLIVLIDSKSASAAEIFARLVQLEKRGIVIGDQSAGAVMESRQYSHELGADSVIPWGTSMTDADVIMSDGKSIERVGVIPDELMLPSAEDMVAHRDPVMVRAVELAGGKIDPLKAGQLFPIEWRNMH